MLCSICNFDKSEFDEVSGTTVCVNCGIVLEESTLITEITFAETSGGYSIAQGSFVGESGRVSGRSKFGKRVESQDQALENGHRSIAARMNGFRRTVREMIYIVKVGDVTIEKRLREFNKTESAQLSVRDFRTTWLDTSADPPLLHKDH